MSSFFPLGSIAKLKITQFCITQNKKLVVHTLTVTIVIHFDSLIHFGPMDHFYTPRKSQKSNVFLTFSEGIEMEHLAKKSYNFYNNRDYHNHYQYNIGFTSETLPNNF